MYSFLNMFIHFCKYHFANSEEKIKLIFAGVKLQFTNIKTLYCYYYLKDEICLFLWTRQKTTDWTFVDQLTLTSTVCHHSVSADCLSLLHGVSLGRGTDPVLSRRADSIQAVILINISSEPSGSALISADCFSFFFLFTWGRSREEDVSAVW